MAMTREQLSELMSAYLDGEVSPREKAEAENVLRADPAARRLLEELRQTAAVLAALPRHAAPPHLATELDAQLERAQLLSGFRANEGDSASPKTPWQTSLKAAAMLAIVLGAGWWFLSLQQEHRPDGLAEAPSRKARELESESGAASPESPKPATPPIEAESLIASGADPVILVTQSFEPEPIRLRVVARNETERDALSKQLTTQLAVANTENLANRETSSEKKQPVGAFYLEGKPGINFVNAQEKQILVRLPQATAQRIVDDVVAGGTVHADQLALQVGPAIIRGPDNARGMLQMMAEKDQPAPSQPQPETPAAFANSRGRSTSTSFVNTLGEIVGLGPLMKKAPAGDKGDRAAVASRGATGEEGVRSTGTEPSASSAAKSAEFVDRVGGAEKSESEGTRAETAHDSLVSKRLAVALANRAEENAGRPSDIGAPRTQPSPNPSISPPLSTTADRFITMVIEFAIPESKPPARTNAGRTRS